MAGLAGLLRAEALRAGHEALIVAPGGSDAIGKRKGAYLLALSLPRRVDLQAIARSPQAVGPGRYVYAGSAYGPGGLGARLKRHLLPEKTVHWHIDRLTTTADGLVAVAVPDGRECALVEMLLRTGRFETAVPGFGSTDCRICASHLLAAIGAGGRLSRPADAAR